MRIPDDGEVVELLPDRLGTFCRDLAASVQPAKRVNQLDVDQVGSMQVIVGRQPREQARPRPGDVPQPG